MDQAAGAKDPWPGGSPGVRIHLGGRACGSARSNEEAGPWVCTSVSRENLQVELTAGRHRWLADEPAGVGDDTGPNPYQLLLGALGACTAMTVQMYARRKGWPLDAVEVELDTHKIHARDCADCESDPETRVDIVELELTLRGDLSPGAVRRGCRRSPGRCPVHRTLTTETKIRTRLATPDTESHAGGS